MGWRASSYCEGGACAEVAVTWRTASGCNGGECVQVAAVEDLAVLVRDSTAPGTVLALSPQAWSALVRSVKAAPDPEG